MITVYAIQCSVTGNAYVGVTGGKIAKRFREHKSLAKSGKHTSPKLIAEWRQYGDAMFSAISLETFLYELTLPEKREAEMKWLMDYGRRGKLLNAVVASFTMLEADRLQGVEASRTATGNRWTPETNLKRRLAQLGKPKGHGAKISATKRAKRLMR